PPTGVLSTPWSRKRVESAATEARERSRPRAIRDASPAERGVLRSRRSRWMHRRGTSPDHERERVRPMIDDTPETLSAAEKFDKSAFPENTLFHERRDRRDRRDTARA